MFLLLRMFGIGDLLLDCGFDDDDGDDNGDDDGDDNEDDADDDDNGDDDVDDDDTCMGHAHVSVWY